MKTLYRQGHGLEEQLWQKTSQNILTESEPPPATDLHSSLQAVCCCSLSRWLILGSWRLGLHPLGLVCSLSLAKVRAGLLSLQGSGLSELGSWAIGEKP